MHSKNFFVSLLACIVIVFNTQSRALPACDAEWTIIGAGPAGIVVIGVLIDLGIEPHNIRWVDPEFNVGRLGKYYSAVPGNAKTRQFIEFLNACKTFQNAASPAMQKLYDLDQEFEYQLHVIVEPLQEITNYLCGLITCHKDRLCSLTFDNDRWNVGTQKHCFTSSHVVLATGSHPKRLDYDCVHEIPLDFALDKSCLAKQTSIEDTVAVIGSGQSAILLLKYLSELPVGRIINFYRNPINFENPEGGLKGVTARWARDVLLKTPPINLLRIFNSCDALRAWLPICTKIIYAAGYERNEIPPINNTSAINLEDRSGIIGPRLFGIGIAFPEKFEDEKGNTISRVGLMAFMEYAQEMLPTWMVTKAPLSRFAQFDDLFMIETL
jgi:Pyridine nucleotide-disulphide oxidoreductase